VAAQVDDPLAALAGDLASADVAERPQQPFVKGQAALKRADDEVEVIDRLHAGGLSGHVGTLLARPPGAKSSFMAETYPTGGARKLVRAKLEALLCL
jgi:hypothetical protein